jgi:hypothetical protein
MPVTRFLEDWGVDLPSRRVAVRALYVLWLPVWLLSLTPPLGQPRKYLALYAAIMLASAYIIALSSLGAGGEERIRFPVLPFWFLVAAMNAQDFVNFLRKTLHIGVNR